MGMYTGLRVECTLREEFVPIIDLLHKYSSEERINTAWAAVSQKYPQYKFLKEWANIGRCDFVPFGGVCYMDDNWTDGYSHISTNTNMWRFECSLKNYEDEIEHFLQKVLPPMIISLQTCHVQYEDWDYPDQYKFEAGEIVQVESRRYNEDPSDWRTHPFGV